MKTRILFLCTGNACRSQMAEGWTRNLKGDILESYSAGVERHGLDAIAIKVMAEAGVDIASHRSKLIHELPAMRFDYVITLCSHANETCPLFPLPVKQVHHGFDDPPALAKDLSNEESILDVYRRIRDEIKAYVLRLPKALK